MQAVGQRGSNALLRFLGVGGIPHAGRRRPPALLWAPAVAVAVAMALPLVYLVERSLDSGGDVLGLLWRTRTLEIALRSAALVDSGHSGLGADCGAAGMADGAHRPAPATLLVRRHRASVGDSQLRGRVSGGGGAGVSEACFRGCWRDSSAWRRLPDISGLFGAALTITLLSFPYTLLSVRASLWGQDPALDEMSRSLGNGQWKTLWRVTLPQMRPSIAAGSLLVALYTLSDFGAVSLLRLRDLHLGHLPAIRDRFRPVLGRGVVARDDWGRPLAGGAGGAGPRPFALLPGGDGRSAAGVACAFGPMAVARLWVCGRRDRTLAGRAAGAAGVLGHSRHRGGGAGAASVGQRSELGVRVRLGRACGSRCCRARRPLHAAVSGAAELDSRAAGVHGLRAAGDRRGAGAHLLRRAIRNPAISDAWGCWSSRTWCSSSRRRWERFAPPTCR